jgi:hypothetical protein
MSTFVRPTFFARHPSPRMDLHFLTVFVSPFSSPLLTPQSSRRRCVCNFCPMCELEHYYKNSDLPFHPLTMLGNDMCGFQQCLHPSLPNRVSMSVVRVHLVPRGFKSDKQGPTNTVITQIEHQGCSKPHKTLGFQMAPNG